MSVEDVFEVDPEALTHATDEMAACHARLSDLAAELERRITALHLSWDGEAAQAHHEAQAEWDRGFREMRDALDQMRAVGRAAHSNYTSAAATNLRMWEQVG